MADLEARTQQIGRRLLGEARGRLRRWWGRFGRIDSTLHKLMANDELRVAALRFVDVLPALHSDAELARHLEEYFGEKDLPLPWPALSHWGLRQSRRGVAPRLVAPVVRAAAGRMARRFIAGATIDTARGALHELHRHGMGFTLDMLGEASLAESEADAYQCNYLHLIEGLAPIVAGWRPGERMDRINGRVSPRLNLSVKLTALYSQFDAIDPEATDERVKTRLRRILHEARGRGAFVTFDMEQYDTKDLTLSIFRELLDEPDLADWPDAGIAIQAYLRETPDDLAELIEWAKRRPAPVTVRLVRGAYWDYEVVIARQHGWAVPVWETKAETDACYERCLRMLFEAAATRGEAGHAGAEPAVATHNVRSLALAMALAERHGLRPDQYEMQMLFGMADPLKAKLVEHGQRLRVYVPFGELIPGMAYLVRRLLENTGSQSFMRLGFAEDAPPEQLLAPPEAPAADPAEAVVPAGGGGAVAGHNPGARPSRDVGPFVNTPVRRFTTDAEREGFTAAIERVRRQLGEKYPLVIGGGDRWAEGTFDSIDPAEPSQVVGTTASATPADAREAIAAAAQAFDGWSRTPAEERARILIRAAELLGQRRDEFAAWEAFESGKPWRDADGDVVEAIDFINYYAREAVRLGAGVALDVPGETNRYIYGPRGVVAVIAPWNFPLAIPTGMSMAAVAAGNTVVLKPAPQSPVVIAKLMEVLGEAGLPPGVLNYLPGGDEAGKALVEHPGVAMIAFTGSMAAGCQISAAAARVADGQDRIKHVIAEMGGKNALVIDADADLDDAVAATTASAFGYAGQKCSACSRAIVVGDLYEAYLDRLTEAAGSLHIGPPTSPGVTVSPVIDAEAFARIRKAIDDASDYAQTVLDPDVDHLGEGYYIGPTIFRDVPPRSALAQEEVFGPVLAVMRAESFDEALALANGTRYALTGGVISRSPAHLEKARREFIVGNLYLNRKITGSIVNRQPFGGMKMSGTNAKAGGPDYLLHFLEPRCVTENTIRRGFSSDFMP